MEWTYIIIYSVAFGVLSAIGVAKKSRDQTGWFFIGLIFGVFGFIASLIVDKKEDDKSDAEVPHGHDPSRLTKKCPDCAELIKLEAKVCRFCQRKFSEEEVAQEFAKAEEAADKALPQSLRAINGEVKVDCPHCKQHITLEDSEVKERKYVCPVCEVTVKL
jgi:hypothetical protein